MATTIPILLIHGGAGDISDACVPGKLDGMKRALRYALQELSSNPSTVPGGSALDAVEAAVRAMELDKHFNAGYGSCLNIDGKVEVEASIMEGRNLNAGCVTLLHDIMHPILVARRVMENTNHTFLGGPSAQKFATEQGFSQLSEGSLVTGDASIALTKFKAQQKESSVVYGNTELDKNEKTGTVGAVALDSQGNIAVATSTGGMTGKLAGRIGDTPLLGCGTYADNNVGGVSTTGNGEIIMRFNLAQRILASLRTNTKSAQDATKQACQEMTERLGGTGGAITIDKNGNIGIHWTSKRMAWAYVKNDMIHYGIDAGDNFEESFFE